MSKELMKIHELTFTISGNGFADGPSQALRDYLLEHNAKRVITVSHPLVAEGPNTHVVTTYRDGKVSERAVRLPNKPPYTYLFDPLAPLRLPKDDIWFGFNNLACLRGLARKKVGRTKKVIYWAVDFVPNRFGTGIATKGYDKVDSYVARKADFRVEVSQAALDARTRRLELDKKISAKGLVIPMGAWLKSTPKTTSKSWEKQIAVYMGHLVERQGVATFVEAINLLKRRGSRVKAEVIGGGPMLDHLKSQAKELGIEKAITFHGFIKSHKDVEKILSKCTVAVAPYQVDPANFTQYADPGKLKAYMGASLPIVVTAVPPNVNELVAAGVAKVVEDNSEEVAEGVEYFLSNESRWTKAHKSSANKAKEFDWDVLLKAKLKTLGIE